MLPARSRSSRTLVDVVLDIGHARWQLLWHVEAVLTYVNTSRFGAFDWLVAKIGRICQSGGALQE